MTQTEPNPFLGDDPIARLLYRGRDLRWRALFAALRRHCRGAVLDVGGGSFIKSVIRQRIPFEHWTVVEPRVIDLPSVGDSRVSTQVGDGLALEFPDASFDTVLSIQVLEHVFEPIRMIQELYRVAKPGGTLIVMVPQTANTHHAPRHYQNFTRYWLQEAARRLGAETVEHHALGGAWSTIASRLLLQYAAVLGVKGYQHPGARRSLKFWLLLPVGIAVSALTFPFALFLSLADMEEEANNHLAILRKRGYSRDFNS